MAKTERGESLGGLTPLNRYNIWLLQAIPWNDSFVATAASANFIHIRLCRRYLVDILMFDRFSVESICLLRTHSLICSISLSKFRWKSASLIFKFKDSRQELLYRFYCLKACLRITTNCSSFFSTGVTWFPRFASCPIHYKASLSFFAFTCP